MQWNQQKMIAEKKAPKIFLFFQSKLISEHGTYELAVSKIRD